MFQFKSTEIRNILYSYNAKMEKVWAKHGKDSIGIIEAAAAALGKECAAEIKDIKGYKVAASSVYHDKPDIIIINCPQEGKYEFFVIDDILRGFFRTESRIMTPYIPPSSEETAHLKDLRGKFETYLKGLQAKHAWDPRKK